MYHLRSFIDEISTVNFWTKYWFYWLWFVAISWLVMELIAILDAHITGQRNIQDWTLSDTIRRWSFAHRCIAPFTVGIMAMLAYHFFVQLNK